MAADSLLEGMEETLTLHKLGLAAELGKSLGTTNCIESIMSQAGQYTDKVDYWRNSILSGTDKSKTNEPRPDYKSRSLIAENETYRILNLIMRGKKDRG